MNDDKLQNPFGRLLNFLDQLEEVPIHYDLKHVRDSIMISAYTAEGIWEIEFFEDGTIETELFKRDEGVDIVAEEWLDQFIESNKD